MPGIRRMRTAVAWSAALVSLFLLGGEGRAQADGGGGQAAHEGLGTVLGEDVCKTLLRALESGDRRRVADLWTNLRAFDGELRRRAVEAATTLGDGLARSKAGLAEDGGCMLAPMERDRFGWISRQNTMKLVSADGETISVDFDLSREKGRLFLTGELRVVKGAARGAVAIGFFREIVGREIGFFELTYYLAPVGWTMVFVLWVFMMLVLPPERKRFTIAHELGHIVMPHRGGYQICYPGKNKRMEAAADRFAAELLMPEPLVRKLWSRYKDNTEYRASVMADIFAVSVSAMRIRIRRLGLR